MKKLTDRAVRARDSLGSRVAVVVLMLTVSGIASAAGGGGAREEAATGLSPDPPGALSAATSTEATQQEQMQRPHFGATVELVQLQVMVGDEDGLFVPGLTREDFRLWIDGRPRDVSVVYEVDLRDERPRGRIRTAAEVPGLAGATSASAPPPAGWRQFLLFFDLGFNSPQGIKRAQEAAAGFLRDHVRPDDLVAVATFSHVGGIHLLSPFTLDRAQVSEAVATMGLRQAGRIVDPAGFDLQAAYEELEASGGGGRGGGEGAAESGAAVADTLAAMSRADFRRYREATASYVDQLAELGRMMQAARGRKHLVLFSQGFDDRALTGEDLETLAADSALVQQNRLDLVNPESRFGSADLRVALEEAVDALRAADTVVHAFDTYGLDSGGGVHGLQFLSLLSAETSGSLIINTNDLDSELEELEEQTSAFYVIAYTPQDDDPDVVELEVEVTKDGVEVVSAPSRLAPPPSYADMDAGQRQMQLAELISKGIERRGFSFQMEAIPFIGDGDIHRLATLIEVPWDELEALAQLRGDDRIELEILGYVLDENDSMLDSFSRGTGLDLAALRSSPSGRLPFRYYDLLWSRPGRYRVRVLLRESETGQIATHTIDIAVPDFASGRPVLSGPVFIDTEHPGLLIRGIDPASPPQHKAHGPVAYPILLGERELTPSVQPILPPGGPFVLLMTAHHLTRHPVSGRTRTTVLARAIDASGDAHEVSDIAVLDEVPGADESSTGILLRAHLPANLRRGAYTLRVEVADGIAGVRIERDLHMVVAY